MQALQEPQRTDRLPCPLGRAVPSGAVVARFAGRIYGDGFQAEDVLALASGYWVKQYHEELNEDLKQIKGSMAMLGDVPEDAEEGDQVRKKEL